MHNWNQTPVDAKILGRRIRQAREQKRLSQEELASLFGRDQRAISEYELGKRRIAAVELPILADILEVPVRYFYEGEVALDDYGQAILHELANLPTDAARRIALDLVRLYAQALRDHLD